MLFTWVAFRRRSSIKETVGIYGWKSNLVLLMRSSHPLLLLFPWRWTVTCTYTLEMRSNSFVIACVCSARRGMVRFDSPSWNEGVMSLFLWGFRVTGMRSWRVKTTLDSSLQPASPPPPPRTPPSLKHYLSSPYVSYTEVAPHPFPLSPGLDSKHALFKTQTLTWSPSSVPRRKNKGGLLQDRVRLQSCWHPLTWTLTMCSCAKAIKFLQFP